jgi:chlorite dismutase
MSHRHIFRAAGSGMWRLLSMQTVVGDLVLPEGASHLTVHALDEAAAGPAPVWTLIGARSHVRYATRREMESLKARQQGLGRPQARRAALIPIRKSPAWWELAQDDRREIFEETSHHTAIGLDYLPAVARQLYHCRDLDQPFDFLTWFEYAPGDADAFEMLVSRLRETAEWGFVDREIDIRLERQA